MACTTVGCTSGLLVCASWCGTTCTECIFAAVGPYYRSLGITMPTHACLGAECTYFDVSDQSTETDTSSDDSSNSSDESTDVMETDYRRLASDSDATDESTRSDSGSADSEPINDQSADITDNMLINGQSTDTPDGQPADASSMTDSDSMSTIINEFERV